MTSVAPHEVIAEAIEQVLVDGASLAQQRVDLIGVSGVPAASDDRIPGRLSTRETLASALALCADLRKGKPFGQYPTLVQLIEDLGFIEATLLDTPEGGDAKRDKIIARLVGGARVLAGRALLEQHASESTP